MSDRDDPPVAAPGPVRGAEQFPLLLEPLVVGPVRASNRIVVGAHFTAFAEPNPTFGEPGRYGRRYGAYLGARARGGAGIVIAGQISVHPTTAYHTINSAGAWDDAAAVALTDVVEPVHEGGALAFAQLSHTGAANVSYWSKTPVWSPSGRPTNGEAPVTMSTADIEACIEGFATCAADAARAGFDGIEVHAAHGYLVHQFLSPDTNRRTDEYGGSEEARLRFCRRVLEAVRAAAGPSVAVGVRLVGHEERDDATGLTDDDAARIASALEADGLVDFVNVSVGLATSGMVRPLYEPHLLGVYAAATVRRALTGTPVFAVHRILTPAEAEHVLASGAADAVTVVRAFIADPDWGRKAADGRADEIRPCTGCNQGCVGSLNNRWPMTCDTNPEVGRETEPPPRPAARARRVVVVGGGPAGLEAARVAAGRGHDVVVLEAAEQVGGRIRLAARLPGRAELMGFVRWRAQECRRLGVRIEVGAAVDGDAVVDRCPDVVVVATGARATVDAPSALQPPPICPPGAWWVVDHEEALARATAGEGLGPRVVIVDAVGHIEGIGLGELLARAGHEVHVVMATATPPLLDVATATYALRRATRAGARWWPSTVARMSTEGEVELVDVHSGLVTSISIDHLVVRTNGVPIDGLYHDLIARGVETVRIGDALAARTVDRAIADGWRVGTTL